MTTVEPAPATLAYTEFLLATASTGSLAEICAAMTPCMRLYAHLGGAVAARYRRAMTLELAFFETAWSGTA